MSRLTEEGQGGEAGSSALQTQGTSRSNLEERLAAARAKREKLLKAKGKSLDKPKLQRPRFLDEDPAARLGSLSAGPGATAYSDRPAMRPPEDVAGTLGANSQPSQAALGRSRLTPVVDAGDGRAMKSSMPMVAFACFFGLGFGMVLSFGVVVAMGWISVNDIRRDVVVSEPGSIAVEAPAVSTVALSELTPVENTESMTFAVPASENPVGSDKRHTPELHAAVSADPVAPAINAPAPRFDTAAVDDAIISGLSFQPVDVFLPFESPVHPAVAPRLQGVLDETEDALPILPQKSTVKVASVVANLNQPLIEKSRHFPASTNDVTPARMAMPALFEGSPGVVPKGVQQQPDRLVVFDDGIQGFVYSAPSDLDLLIRASVVDAPPTKAISARVPVIGRQAFEMPEIGPADVKSTLSAQLGMNADAARRFRLVTFAPTNVSEEKIADNAEFLSATGFPVASVNRVDFRVSKNHVRYYNASDEKVARAIAAEIGGAARDFTYLRNAPPPGQVEIWLQGNSKAVRAATGTQRQPVSAAQRRAAAKAQLEQRLVNSLRRGDHLKGSSQ